MADKLSPLSRISTALIPTEDEDVGMTQSRQGYIDAQRKLIEAFENRNQLFDPTLLAMAQGFLAPTKSGTFGESLSNVTGAVAPVAEREQKRGQELAQMKFELAAAELGQRQEAEAMKQFNKLISPMQMAAGQGQASETAEGKTPTGFTAPTPQAIAQLKRMNLNYGKIIEDMVKLEQDRYLIAQNGTVFDKRTGQYVNPENIPGQAQTEYDIPGLGKYLMTANEYSIATRSRAKAAAEGWRDDWDRQFKEGANPAQITAPGAPSRPVAEGVAPSSEPPTAATQRRKTTTETALEKESELTRQKARAEADEKARQAALQRGDDALLRKQAAESVIELSKAPGMDQALAVFEKPGFLPAIGKLIEEGLKIGPGFSISVPQIRDVFTANKIKLPKIAGESNRQYEERVNQVIDNLSLLSSKFAEISFTFRSMAAGQGSISNFEQLIFSSMGPTIRDRPRVIQAKAQHLIERSNFEQQVRDSLLDSNMTYEQFRRSPQYQTMLKEYDAKLRGIYQGMTSGANPQVAGTPSTARQGYSAARDALRQDIFGR